MNGKRDLVPNIVLGLALVSVLVFAGLYFLLGATSIGGNIALGLAVVLLLVYVYLRPQEVLGGLGSRQTLYGGNTLLMTVFFVAILVLINFLSMKQFKRWDLTAEKQFSLSPETVEILKNLPSPVTALSFSTAASGGARSNTATLLDQYRAVDRKFQVETIDPEAQPTLARQYGITYDGALVLMAGDKTVTVNSPTESDITSALIKVTRSTRPIVYFTTGHGERDLEDGGDVGFAVAKGGLDRDGFDIKPLMLVTTNTVPADASLVIIAGPRSPFQPRETEVLRAYLARGGRLMAMVDASFGTKDNSLGDAGLGGLLSEGGISLRDDLVLDPVSSQMTDPGVTIAAKYGSSPITDKLGNTATVFPLVRSLALASPLPAGISLVSLVQTSDQAWGTSDFAALASAATSGRFPGPGPKDAKGALTIAASATNTQTKARLVVIGSSSFVMNALSRQPGNLDLFLNGVNWLAEQESQITIRPKPFEMRQLIPSRLMSVQVFGISVILMPLAVLVVGAIVWWRRR